MTKKKFYYSGERIKFIDAEIRALRYPSPKKVCGKFEVGERTIRRDFEYLKNRLRAPLAFDYKNKGYYYTNEAFCLPNIYMDNRELFAMSIANKILGQYKNTPYLTEVENVFRKVIQYLPKAAFEENNISFQQRPFVKVDKEKWQVVQKAIDEKMSLDITYEAYTNNGEITNRRVDPYHLLNRGNWYVIAYCHLKKELRDFAVARIRKCAEAKVYFEYPEGFDIEEVLKERFDWERGGKSYHVRLHFSKYQARWIRERLWHPTQKIEEQQDKSLILSFTTTGLNDVKRWVMYHGKEVKVLQPKKLAAMVREDVYKLYEIYNTQ